MNQSQAEMALRLECLRLACAVSKDTERADAITTKADLFYEYVEGEKSSIIAPKLLISQ